MSGERTIVGIDLGTTHCAVSWARPEEVTVGDGAGGGADAERACVSDFSIHQLVQAGQVAALPLLPSSLYLAAPGEFAEGAATLPWSEGGEGCVIGAWARRLGSRTPGRLVASSKSWLCHAGVDRTAAILPWGGLDTAPRLSPVEAAERLLRHIASAWDAAHPGAPLSEQDCTITVPASFDEAARALTVEAARRAGIPRPYLLEEPQAAFYDFAWTHRKRLAEELRGARLILVIDVGGGTTDLSLIQAAPGVDEPELRRIAVGEHLMLGGDNMDIALARIAEGRLCAGGRRLSAIQWSQLVHAAREAKETLLAERGPERHGIAVAGGGSRLIGDTLSCHLEREEVRACVLDGFFPACSATEPLRRGTRAALQELGLPYAQDPVITRQIAHFLRRHADLARAALDGGDPASTGEVGRAGDAQAAAGAALSDAGGRWNHTDAEAPLPRPDAILLNGGVFNAPPIVGRLLEVLASWWPKEGPPRLLPHRSLDLAVARGAVARGLARRGFLRGIEGGAAHAIYIGVGGGDQPAERRKLAGTSGADTRKAAAVKGAVSRAVCVLPRGLPEGSSVELRDLPFSLRLNTPVRFPLYAGTDDRPAAAGLVREIGDDLEALPPLQTVLRAPEAAGGEESVYLSIHYTELGTLEVWCVSRGDGRRWKLEFDLRKTADKSGPDDGQGGGPGRDDANGGRADEGGEATACRDEGDPEGKAGTGGTQGKTQGAGAPNAEVLALLERYLGKGGQAPTPKEFKMALRTFEEKLGPREAWDLPLLRGLWDALQPRAAHRRRSAAHERLYFQLAGYCLRPGFGEALDGWRCEQSLKLLDAGLAHGADIAGWNEYWIHWRRIAGGLDDAGQRRLWELLKPHLARRVPPHPPKHLPRPKGVAFEGLEEMVRTAAALEDIEASEKMLLGDWLVERVREAPGGAGPWAWALGRLGARRPLHGSLHRVVPVERVSAWIELLLERGLDRVEGAPFAISQLARLTGDRGRDIDDALRTRVREALGSMQASERLQRLVTEAVELDETEEARALGDALPIGLHLSHGSGLH